MARLLDRLTPQNSAGLAFKQLWQTTCEKIEAQFDSIATLDAEQTQLIADLQTAVRNMAIATSYTAPGDILSASDAGTDATITVADHTRVYADITSVAVTGGPITGLAYSTTYYVYYDDPDRAGGAVTYVATTNANAALPSAAAGRHYCGKVTTPASGGTATSGGSNPPSGGGTIDRSEINSTL